jgi:hypothetical protein
MASLQTSTKLGEGAKTEEQLKGQTVLSSQGYYKATIKTAIKITMRNSKSNRQNSKWDIFLP